MRLSLDSFTCSQAFYPAFLLSHTFSVSSTILFSRFCYCFNKHHHFCKNTTTQCWESIFSCESIAFPSLRAPKQKITSVFVEAPPGKLALKREVSLSIHLFKAPIFKAHNRGGGTLGPRFPSISAIGEVGLLSLFRGRKMPSWPGPTPPSLEMVNLPEPPLK